MSVYVDSSDDCNELAFTFGIPPGNGAAIAARQFSIKVNPKSFPAGKK